MQQQYINLPQIDPDSYRGRARLQRLNVLRAPKASGKLNSSHSFCTRSCIQS